MVCVFGSMFHACMHVEDSTGYALEHCKKKFWKKKQILEMESWLMKSSLSENKAHPTVANYPKPAKKTPELTI